jgi:hypothetical protein
LPASLAFDRVFSAIGDAGCSLGLTLSGLAHADLAGAFALRSAHAFCEKESVRTRSRRRLSVSVGQRWVPPLIVRAMHRRHNPHRVSAPVRSKSFGLTRRPELCVHLTARRALPPNLTAVI